MKKISYSLLPCAVALLIAATASSQVTQTEMTFQPDACRGKDAHVTLINGIPSAATANYANADELPIFAWTFYANGGSDGYGRTFIDFTDLQLIPQGTTVTYAYLSLYGKSSSATMPQGNSGDNGCYVQRVTSAWAENTVTWNTQPSATTTNQVALPASTSTWNYNVIDLNVTALVQDIINQPPASRYGFLIKLQTESYYRSIVFASSDNTDATKHPKLRVGLNFCSSAAARTATPEGKIYTPDVIDAAGKVSNGLSALVKTNLSSNQVSVDYTLPQDGKTVLEIVSYDGALLKSIEVEGTKGKHTKTITLDAPLAKNKMAVLVVKQGNAKTSSPFLISQ
jgi:hypothetical protein